MKPGIAVSLLRHLGPSWVAYRAWRMLARRTGLHRRRMREGSWDEVRLEELTISPEQADPRWLADSLGTTGRFFFSADDRARFRSILEAWDAGDASTGQRIDELAAGRVRLFSGELQTCGWPPRWHTNVLTGEAVESRKHFDRISEFGDDDVKVVWELSRFTFAFDLVRAWWRSGDERCPELFWEAVEDWRAKNPPNTGVNWKCGQESSLRAMAWCFGLWGFLDAPQTIPERCRVLVEMLAATAARVEADIGYALSQKNNHGVSEATALLTIGLLLPMLRNAERWAQLGRRCLERLARDLIYDDGGFSQYSANYHRLMLDDFIWAIRLAELAGRPLSPELVERVGRAGRFLLAIQDRTTGGVPRYGHDDGAHVLPLAECSYEDFRPVVQATAALDPKRPLPCGAGPWNEKLLWLFGPDVLRRVSASPREDETDQAQDRWRSGGYGLLRRGDDFAFVRGGRFRHRPSQADLLHVDIWWRGRNVALDPGTFSYNAPGVWADIPFGATASHNTVGVDGVDQLERVSRFLYLPWSAAPLSRRERSPAGHIGLLELEHVGYHRLPDPVSHRRAVVQLGRSHWLVVDRLEARREHDYRLHWLLADAVADERDNGVSLAFPDGSYGVQILASTSTSISLVRAEKGSARGWYSPRYQHLAPALSLAATARSADLHFVTVLGPGEWSASMHDDVVRARADSWSAEVVLGAPHGSEFVRTVSFDGDAFDRLGTC